MDVPEDVTTQFWSLASTPVKLAGSVCARFTAAPGLALANFLYAVRPDSVADLLVDVVDQGALRVVVETDTPPWVEAELVLRGWRPDNELRLTLPPGVELTGRAGAARVMPATDVDPNWEQRSRMFRADHLEEDARRGDRPRPESATASIVAHRQALERQATYLGFQRAGELAGFLCTWVSPGGAGVIEDVFVDTRARGQGLAAGLLQNAVGTLREQGAGRITIAAEVGDTPAQLYAHLGFRPERLTRALLPPVAT